MKAVTYAKAIIFNSRGQVLILQRSVKDERRAGGPDFPGGQVEAGEEPGAGISREVREEAGLQVDSIDFRLICGTTEAYRDRSVVRLLYWAYVPQAEITLSFEHDSYQWVEPEEVSKAFPHPFYGKGFDYAMQHDLFDFAA